MFADSFSLELEWQQVFYRTLFSILTNLINAIVWMVSTQIVISKSSSSCTNSLVTVPKAPVPIGITITFMFHSFFNSRARLSYLAFFLLSFKFSLWLAGMVKSTIWQVLFFSWLLLGLVWLRLGDLFVSQNPRGVWAFHSLGQVVKFQFFVQFPVDYLAHPVMYSLILSLC